MIVRQPNGSNPFQKSLGGPLIDRLRGAVNNSYSKNFYQSPNVKGSIPRAGGAWGGIGGGAGSGGSGGTVRGGIGGSGGYSSYGSSSSSGGSGGSGGSGVETDYMKAQLEEEKAYQRKRDAFGETFATNEFNYKKESDALNRALDTRKLRGDEYSTYQNLMLDHNEGLNKYADAQNQRDRTEGYMQSMRGSSYKMPGQDFNAPDKPIKPAWMN